MNENDVRNIVRLTYPDRQYGITHEEAERERKYERGIIEKARDNGLIDKTPLEKWDEFDKDNYHISTYYDHISHIANSMKEYLLKIINDFKEGKQNASN